MKERPYSEFQDLLCLEEKNEMKKSTCYHSDRAAVEFIDCFGIAIKEDFLRDILNAW